MASERKMKEQLDEVRYTLIQNVFEFLDNSVSVKLDIAKYTQAYK